MWRNTLARVDVLSEDEVELVHRHAMTILEEVGVDFLHPRAVELFEDAGMAVEGDRVRFDPDWVMSQAARVPPLFQVRARGAGRAVTIGGDHMVNAPVHGPPFVTDLDRGRRGATIEDFTNFDRLSQAVPQIHCAGGTTVEPEDLPLATRHLDMVYSHLRWTDKPFMGSVISAGRARDSIAMAAIALGGRERIEATPAILALVDVNSPLRYDERMLGALLEYAEANQPVVVTPFLMAGAAPPMGLAQQFAEALAGIALIQVVRPGAPCVLGSVPDGRAGSAAFGTPASALGILAGAQMARRYRIPFRGGGALTSSGSPDARAAYESMLCLWPTVLGGVHLVVHAAGLLESAQLASYEKFAIDVEMLRTFEWMLERGALHEAGPCAPTADGAAHERWKRMLAEYEDPGIDPGVDEELRRFMATRTEQIAREPA